LIHGYYKIKLGVLWRFITRDVPTVLPLLESAAADADP
jgi:hypothetical protein